MKPMFFSEATISKVGRVFCVALIIVLHHLQAQTSRIKTNSERGGPPSLGLSRSEKIPAVMDVDAGSEEEDLKKQYPENQLAGLKTGMHEADLMRQFVEGFQNSEECKGISLYLKTEKKADFTVQISVSGHDTTPRDEHWVWFLDWPGDPSSKGQKEHGVGGMGTQTSAKLTARDVCLTIWDDINPNHFKKPGGRVK